MVPLFWSAALSAQLPISNCCSSLTFPVCPVTLVAAAAGDFSRSARVFLTSSNWVDRAATCSFRLVIFSIILTLSTSVCDAVNDWFWPHRTVATRQPSCLTTPEARQDLRNWAVAYWDTPFAHGAGVSHLSLAKSPQPVRRGALSPPEVLRNVVGLALGSRDNLIATVRIL